MTRKTLSGLALSVAAAAIAAPLALPAVAQSADEADLILSRDITSAQIYAVEDQAIWSAEGDMSYGDVPDDWTRIGEVEDIVLDGRGDMIGVVAEVGGFLDMGDKHVMLEMADLRLVPVDDRSYAVVTRRTEEQLERMTAVDEAWWN